MPGKMKNSFLMFITCFLLLPSQAWATENYYFEAYIIERDLDEFSAAEQEHIRKILEFEIFEIIPKLNKSIWKKYKRDVALERKKGEAASLADVRKKHKSDVKVWARNRAIRNKKIKEDRGQYVPPVDNEKIEQISRLYDKELEEKIKRKKKTWKVWNGLENYRQKYPPETYERLEVLSRMSADKYNIKFNLLVLSFYYDEKIRGFIDEKKGQKLNGYKSQIDKCSDMAHQDSRPCKTYLNELRKECQLNGAFARKECQYLHKLNSDKADKRCSTEPHKNTQECKSYLEKNTQKKLKKQNSKCKRQEYKYTKECRDLKKQKQTPVKKNPDNKCTDAATRNSTECKKITKQNKKGIAQICNVLKFQNTPQCKSVFKESDQQVSAYCSNKKNSNQAACKNFGTEAFLNTQERASLIGCSGESYKDTPECKEFMMEIGKKTGKK